MSFFKALQTDDLGRVQDLLEKAFDKIEALAFGLIPLATNVAIGGSDTPVFHGLGRPPRGYIVVGNPTGAVVFDGKTSTNPALFVNLKASVGGGKYSLLFF